MRARRASCFKKLPVSPWGRCSCYCMVPPLAVTRRLHDASEWQIVRQLASAVWRQRPGQGPKHEELTTLRWWGGLKIKERRLVVDSDDSRFKLFFQCKLSRNVRAPADTKHLCSFQNSYNRRIFVFLRYVKRRLAYIILLFFIGLFTQ